MIYMHKRKTVQDIIRFKLGRKKKKSEFVFCNRKGEVHLFEKDGDFIKTIAFLGWSGRITARGYDFPNLKEYILEA